MSLLTSKKLAFHTAEQFKESFFEPEPATIGYVFIGKHTTWPDEESPDTLTDTVYDEKTVWDNMYAAKKITGSELELAIPKVEWTANAVYREFDDTIAQEDLLTANTNQNLKPMYVLNSENSVYKCLSNSSSANASSEPTGQNLSANGVINTSDGYIWKYMYNIRPSNRFLSNTWIPVPTSTSALDYDVTDVTVVDGELIHIVVTNGGSNYVHSNVTVSAFTSGCTILQLANTANVSANMTVSGTGIPSLTYISSVDTPNSKITISNSASANGGGSGNTLFLTTRVDIQGDGSQATATATLSNNEVSSILLTTPGINYSYANVSVYGSGTGATARAVLPPKFGHGYNPAKELGGSNVIISMRIGEVDSSEDGLISTNTSIRQYGLLRNPHKYGSNTAANNSTANSVISQTTDVTLISGDEFELNEFVFQGTTSNTATFFGYVNDQTSTEVKLTGVKGTPTNGVPLKGTTTNPTGRIVVTSTNPEFEPYTGGILYVENIEQIQRTDGQAENLKFVIKF